jgi:hypothetical protein
MELRDARRLFRIADVLHIDSGKRVIVCPLPGHPHHNNTPSFSIGIGKDGFEHFYCHGTCGREGDVIDLMGYMEIPGYDGKNPEHVSRAVSLLAGGTPINIAMPQQETPMLMQNAWMKYQPIGDLAIEYAVGRGLSAHTIGEFKLGQLTHTNLEALAIPVFCEDVLWAMKFRKIEGPQTIRFWSEKGSRQGLFNLDHVKWVQEPVLILKGEIPVMLLHQMGFNACCMTGGEGQKVSDWVHYLTFATKRILVGDNDINPATREKMQAFAKKRAEEWNAELRFPPSEYKDIDEWILKEPFAVNEIRSWYDG